MPITVAVLNYYTDELRGWAGRLATISKEMEKAKAKPIEALGQSGADEAIAKIKVFVENCESANNERKDELKKRAIRSNVSGES